MSTFAGAFPTFKVNTAPGCNSVSVCVPHSVVTLILSGELW